MTSAWLTVITYLWSLKGAGDPVCARPRAALRTSTVGAPPSSKSTAAARARAHATRLGARSTVVTASMGHRPRVSRPCTRSCLSPRAPNRTATLTTMHPVRLRVRVLTIRSHFALLFFQGIRWSNLQYYVVYLLFILNKIIWVTKFRKRNNDLIV